MTDFELLKHLHNRAGFGATASEIQPYLEVPYESSVEQLLSSTSTTTIIPPPDWIGELPPSKRFRKQLSREERKQFRKKIRARHMELKAWWLNELIETPNPLIEKMTLFWHNHFTSSLKKVKWPNFIYQQNILFRSHCMGNFGRLLHAVSRDPAMLIYLDNVSNNKDKPNENFARELLELFTLGEGNYTEHDVREAARAFTGWKVRRQTAEYRFVRKKHDFGSKVFLGKTGKLDGDDIIKRLLEHPRTAKTITAKLWKEFVSLTPNDAKIYHLAEIFRSNNYEIKPVLKAIFLSPEFVDSSNYGTLIKSPMELTIGTIRQLQIHVHDVIPIARYNRRLGQDIMDPPTVKGWPGGKRWISADTLLARQAFLQKLSRGRDMHHMHKKRMKKDKMMMDISMSEKFLLDLTARQLNSDMVDKVLLPVKKINPVSSNDLYKYAMQLLLDPVYQLK